MTVKKTILCVDDEHSLSIQKLTLETRGYRVMTCNTAVEALSIFNLGGVDLVLSNFELPDAPATELVKSIKALCPGNPGSPAERTELGLPYGCARGSHAEKGHLCSGGAVGPYSPVAGEAPRTSPRATCTGPQRPGLERKRGMLSARSISFAGTHPLQHRQQWPVKLCPALS